MTIVRKNCPSQYLFFNTMLLDFGNYDQPSGFGFGERYGSSSGGGPMRRGTGGRGGVPYNRGGGGGRGGFRGRNQQ